MDVFCAINCWIRLESIPTIVRLPLPAKQSAWDTEMMWLSRSLDLVLYSRPFIFLWFLACMLHVMVLSKSAELSRLHRGGSRCSSAVWWKSAPMQGSQLQWRPKTRLTTLPVSGIFLPCLDFMKYHRLACFPINTAKWCWVGAESCFLSSLLQQWVGIENSA
jgi:hypothetical protein